MPSASTAETLHRAGTVAVGRGRLPEALELLTRAALLDPRNPIIQFNLAATLAGLGRADAALAAVEIAAREAPTLLQAQRLRADLLKSIGRFDAALEGYRRLAALAPRDAAARIQCGNMLAMQDRMEEALTAFEAALALEPDSAEAHRQRGAVLGVLGRQAQAIASLDRAVELAPASADAHFLRSLALLTSGDYERGFREHEWRWHSGLAPSSLERRTLAQPLWLGRESLAGRRILLYSEQGLGDTLQFCRYASLVAQRGARVVLQVQPPLVELLRTLAGVSEIVGSDASPPPCDCQCPLMSLPLALGTRLESVPAPARYLRADPQRVAAWQQRLGERRAPRVGLMWNGNPDNPIERFRGLRLADWLPHLPAGFEYVSLQRFVRDEDRAALRGGAVRDLAAQQTDFGDAAALCECMDVVVSVCTSIAHLGGALGRPTWVLLSRMADWRWLLERDDSPWYPTVRLYRQRVRGEWTAVFARVAADLRERLR
ncbi:MAG TPA: tetratricopeptide repeat-containing glycosyltransferase family protein [Steroidobacteraceae bacterium]|nr:tetratricopeptide repeat-containing glycosyltransferase family protein [Steroidobacteraceae bacterium]